MVRISRREDYGCRGEKNQESFEKEKHLVKGTTDLNLRPCVVLDRRPEYTIMKTIYYGVI